MAVTIQNDGRTISFSLGRQGASGTDGEGIAAGGTTGQVLVKASNTDYDTEWSAAGAGDLLAANNLSDLASAATARTNLGLGTAAVAASSAFATSAQGALADSAQQPPAEGAFVDGDKTKLDAITGTNTGDQDLSALQPKPAEGAFVDGDKTKLDAITGTNTGDQDLSALATKANVLERDNTDIFTPTTDYHPATKKYVDDNSGGSGDLLAANNLSDLANAATARTNLGLGTAATAASSAFATSAQGALADSAQQPPAEGAFVDGDKTKLDAITGTNTGDQDLSALATKANVLELNNTTAFTPDADYEPATKKYVDDNSGGSGDLLAANNLSDLASAATARTNLGLGTAAVADSSAFATSAQGALADSAQQPPAEGAFVDGDKSKLDAITGTNTGDQDLSGLVVKANNLSDLTNAATARTNLGLGTAATSASTAFATAAQGALADSAQQPPAEGAFVDGDKTKLDAITGTNTGDQDLSALATKANVLELDNTTAFTPDADYEPATKKYVDDNVGGGGGGLTDITETLHTTSPNATVNASELQVTGGTTNADFVLAPKGTGAFIIGPQPDSGTTGGNKRGNYATDLQIQRNAASKVASGNNSFQVGANNTTSNAYGVSMGDSNTNSGSQGAICVGMSNTNTCKQGIALGGLNNVSLEFNQAIGYSNTNSGYVSGTWGGWNTQTAWYSHSIGIRALGARRGTFVYSGGRFAANGDAQFALPILRGTTSNATETEIFLESSHRFTVPASGIVAGTVSIVGTKTDGSAVAHFLRQFCAKNVSGTTSDVYSAITIGTDNPAGTSVSVAASDSTDAVEVKVTGIAAENWRWHAIFYANDMKYTS